jgi:sugar lactone lactonase YvrE
MEMKLNTALLVFPAFILASCGGGSSPEMASAATNGNPTAAAAQQSQSVAFGAPASGNSSGPLVPVGTGSGMADAGASAAPASAKALAARFNRPLAIAADTQGNLYVTDYGTVRKITPSGEVSTLAGVAGQFGAPPSGGSDGAGAAARFNILSGITVGSGGNIYVTDTITNTGRIRRITPEGIVTTVQSDVYGLGIAADGSGNIYYTNNLYGNVGVIRPDGSTGTLAAIPEPRGMTVDNAGNLYVANTGRDYPPLGQTAFSCTVERIAPAGVVSTLAGSKAAGEFDNTCGYADGAGAAAKIGAYANGVAADAAGNVYFTDTRQHTIRRITPAGEVGTIAGAPGTPGAVDGTGTAARFNGPAGIAVGRDGNLYVADTENHTIRRVTPQGLVTTVAGKAGESGSADAS